ncbi:unnamed protein product, partial [Prorocentrum cordatum]
ACTARLRHPTNPVWSAASPDANIYQHEVETPSLAPLSRAMGWAQVGLAEASGAVALRDEDQQMGQQGLGGTPTSPEVDQGAGRLQAGNGKGWLVEASNRDVDVNATWNFDGSGWFAKRDGPALLKAGGG